MPSRTDLHGDSLRRDAPLQSGSERTRRRLRDRRLSGYNLAAVAVTLAVWRMRSTASAAAFCLIAVVFAYTTVVNIIERPDGVKIAAFFISAIVIVSLVSRVWRTTELRTGEITLDAAAERFIDQAARGKALSMRPLKREIRFPETFGIGLLACMNSTEA